MMMELVGAIVGLGGMVVFIIIIALLLECIFPATKKSIPDNALADCFTGAIAWRDEAIKSRDKSLLELKKKHTEEKETLTKAFIDLNNKYTALVEAHAEREVSRLALLNALRKLPNG